MRSSESLPSLPPASSTVVATTLFAAAGNQSQSASRPGNASSVLPPALHRDHHHHYHPQSKALNQEEDDDPPLRPSSGYAAQFRVQAKSSLVRCDVAPLLARFEDAALFQNPHRKPLTVVLHEMADAHHRRRSIHAAPDAYHADNSPVSSTDASKPVNALQRQATALILRRRSRSRQPHHNRWILGVVNTTTSSIATTPDSSDKGASRRQQGVLPSRVLFDDSRWPRSSRCDYCQLGGGDLECATCDVIAHAPCFLADFDASARKQKAAFVVPTRFSWLCRDCQRGLQAEYDARAAEARSQQLAQQRLVLWRVVTAYLRMAKDARLFARKKLAVVKIQAIIRGRLARWRFLRMQRNRVRPYMLDTLRVFGRVSSGGHNSDITAIDSRPATAAALEELRLANGFSCNPYLYVTVCDGEDDALQLFCFKTSLRKGLFASSSALNSGEVDVAWPEKLFVPGINGNASFTFTLLSKNGPNNFFLGQAVLRLLDEDDATWRDGGAVELPLRECVEIPPKTAQKQPLRLAHPVSTSHSGSSSVWASQSPSPPSYFDDSDVEDGEWGADKPRLRLSVTLRPLKDVQSHCGYMGLKTTLDGFHANPRWCVLADGAPRVYRHYGVTVASEMVDMARAIDVRLERGHNSLSAVGISHKRVLPPRKHKDEKIATTSKEREKRERRARAPNCVTIEHVTRLFVFECEHGEAARAWHKKLQAAQRHAASSGNGAASATASTVAMSPMALVAAEAAVAAISRP